MQQASVEKCLKKVPSRFALTVAVGKRAEQLSNRPPTAFQRDDRHPITIALEEIAEGKVIIKMPEEDEKPD